MAVQILDQNRLHRLNPHTDYLENSDNIPVRNIEQQAINGRIQKVAIGYFDGTSWPSRRWAFSPLRDGSVPTIDGDSLCDWCDKNWLRDHKVANLWGVAIGSRNLSQKSGDNGEYASASDKNSKKYRLIPANGQDGIVGYVPARDVTESLENGYLTISFGYRLIADSNQVLHLACRGVPYAEHGFTLHGKVWWPIKNPPYADCAAKIEAEAAKINLQIEQHLRPEPIPPLHPTQTLAIQSPTQLDATDDGTIEEETPDLMSAHGVVVEHFAPVENFDELPMIERARAEVVKNSHAEMINSRDDLEPYQKESLIRDFAERVNKAAKERFYVQEAANHSIRGIDVSINQPPTLCQSATSSAMSGIAMGLVSKEPLIGAGVAITVLTSSQLFDEDCFLNKIFRAIGL